MKSEFFNIVLLRSNYETQFIRRQSKIFERDIRQNSHETSSIKYSPGMQHLLNTVK